jgi:hypothetical protein
MERLGGRERHGRQGGAWEAGRGPERKPWRESPGEIALKI